MRIKKRPALLFEALIGLFLIGIVVSFLFRSLHSLAVGSQRAEKLRQTLRVEQKLQSRLQSLFSRLERNSPRPLRAVSLSKEEGSVLFFRYDAGIDPDPRFSGPCLGRLLVDRENTLCLYLSPLDTDAVFRKETLLTDVASCKFLFFRCPQDPETGKGAPAWDSLWEEDAPPSMLRLLIVKNGPGSQEREYPFFLPNPHPVISYL